MTLSLSKSHRASTNAVFHATADMFMELGKQRPEAVMAMADFWKVAVNPHSPAQDVANAFQNALGWSSAEQLLGIAVDLGSPHALMACGQFTDLSSLSEAGTLLQEGSPEEEEADFKTSAKGFPVLPRDERGLVARLMLHREDGGVDLAQIAAASGSPTVWCELLPMAGKRVSWLELALGTGHWNTAQRLWEEQGGRRGFDDQARARLAMAWMTGIGAQNRDWPKEINQEGRRQFLEWWDRLLVSEATLLEPVVVKEGWSNYLLGSSGANPAREILNLVEAGLEQVNEEKPFDMSQVLLAVMNMGGSLNRETFVLRPIDQLLEVVAHLGQNSPLAAAVLERMETIEWAKVSPDAALCIPAVAALRHVGTSEPGWGEASIYTSLWVSMLGPHSETLQRSWWNKALVRAMNSVNEFLAAAPLFRERFSFDDNRFLVRALLHELQDIEEKKHYSVPQKLEKKAAVLDTVLKEVMPVVEVSSTEGARGQWKAFWSPILAALEVFEASKGKSPEAWRAVELAIALPMPTLSPTARGPRF